MAEEKKVDLTAPVAEVVAGDEELAGLLGELGFDVASDETITALAEEAGVDLSIVGMALGAAGYEVEGYVPTEDAKNSPLEDLIQELSKAEPLGAAAASSADPVVANMEVAIRRAQDRGELPKDDAGAAR